jgi:hypothetical protein
MADLCAAGGLLCLLCAQQSLGHTPQHIDSPLTHGTYLIFYLLLLTTLMGHPRTRHLALLSVVAGVTVLSVWTLAIDHTLVLTLREVSENPGPTNVIDLAGYCGIAILICCLLLQESQPLSLCADRYPAGDDGLYPESRADYRPGAGLLLHAASAGVYAP